MGGVVFRAGLKDCGFSVERLAEAMHGFQRHRREDFDIDDGELERLGRWVTDTSRHLEALGQQRHSRGRGR